MQVELASVDEGYCRSCGARITWVKNVRTGKRLPIDGGRACVSEDGEVDLKATPSHFGSCPDSKKWSRSRG